MALERVMVVATATQHDKPEALTWCAFDWPVHSKADRDRRLVLQELFGDEGLNIRKTGLGASAKEVWVCSCSCCSRRRKGSYRARRSGSGGGGSIGQCQCTPVVVVLVPVLVLALAVAVKLVLLAVVLSPIYQAPL